jgi:hypothetical protein
MMTKSYVANLSLLGALALPWLLNCSASPSNSSQEDDKAAASAPDSEKVAPDLDIRSHHARPPHESWLSATDASDDTAPEPVSSEPAPVTDAGAAAAPEPDSSEPVPVTDDPIPTCPAAKPSENAPCQGEGGEAGCAFGSDTCHCIEDHFRCESTGTL